MVTNEAITTMKQGMRIFSGITPRSAEMKRLERISTKVAAMPMPRPSDMLLVTASVGHMPSTSPNTGLLDQSPATRMSLKDSVCSAMGYLFPRWAARARRPKST
ncbi:MAG: hypothetical protein BWY56_01104 [Acidobacteria bacterium ADurb.Bin340]|nr:MAG: hypothetical protein BWY56_01104 [Acidobacteria bacterium ADurb.Bin340]